MKRRTHNPDYPPHEWVKIMDIYPLVRQGIADVNAMITNLREQEPAWFSSNTDYVARDTVQRLLNSGALRLADAVVEIRTREQVPVAFNKSDKPIVAFLAAHDLHDPDGRFEGKARKTANKLAEQAYQGR